MHICTSTFSARLTCLPFGFGRFEDYFSNRVKQLTFTFPEDVATSTGAPFWSAPKRFPRHLQFSATDSSHIRFIMSASILRAESFGIAIPDWAKNTTKLASVINKVAVPQFEPKKGVNIVTDERATNLSSASVDDASVIDDLLAKLEEYAKNLPPGFQMKPIQFEKVCVSTTTFFATLDLRYILKFLCCHISSCLRKYLQQFFSFSSFLCVLCLMRPHLIHMFPMTISRFIPLYNIPSPRLLHEINSIALRILIPGGSIFACAFSYLFFP
jgi:hypothetical protein